MCGGRGPLCHEGGAGGVPDGGGALCWALLLLGLGLLGLEVVEDVLRGLGSRCSCGAGLVLGLEFCSRLRPPCIDGLGLLLGGGLGFWLGCGCRVYEAWAMAVVGGFAVGTGLEARLGDFPRGLGGGVMEEDVVVAADEVVMVVEVVESEAEETDVGDGGGYRAGWAGAGCWVL